MGAQAPDADKSGDDTTHGLTKRRRVKLKHTQQLQQEPPPPQQQEHQQEPPPQQHQVQQAGRPLSKTAVTDAQVPDADKI